MSRNRASVVLASLIAIGLLAFPGGAAWSQEEPASAIEAPEEAPPEAEAAVDEMEPPEAEAAVDEMEPPEADVSEVDTPEPEPVEEAVLESEGELETEFESDDSSQYDHTGWYLRSGIVAGFFDEHRNKVDLDPGVGFSVSVGMRHSALIAGEFNLSFIYEGKTSDFDEILAGAADKTKSVEEYEILYALHAYPLGVIDVNSVPDWVQPYASAGLGFGEIKIGSREEARFLLRFGAGVDVLITERLGVYLDGGYSVITSTTTNNKGRILDGRGHLGLGVLARF